MDETAEMGGGDAPAMVNGAKWAAGVGYGAVEGHREELLLHAVKGLHAGVFEERCQVRVAEDSGIEGRDEGFNDRSAADSIV